MDPSSEYCANKQQGVKPPQETTCLFHSEIENEFPNKQTNKQTNKFVYNPRKIQQFSEVVSVACCLFAQYLKEGLLPSVAGYQQAGSTLAGVVVFQGMNSTKHC